MDKLDKMDKRFNKMLEKDPTSADITTLISRFGTLIAGMRALVTEDWKDFWTQAQDRVAHLLDLQCSIRLLQPCSGSDGLLQTCAVPRDINQAIIMAYEQVKDVKKCDATIARMRALSS